MFQVRLHMGELEVFLRELRAQLSRIEERLRPEPTCLTMVAAARRLGVGLTTLKEMVRKGQIRTSTINSRRMVSLSELERVSRPDAERLVVEQLQRAKAWRPVERKRPPPRR